MDNEDNIRLPDEIISDRLLEDTRNDYEKELDEAINLSYQELLEKQDLSRKYEEQIIKDYNEETLKRKTTFEKLLLDLNKLSKLDKEVREIYNIIDPIIECYCSQYINICILDVETHETIFKLLSKIRTDKNAVELLKTIIILNE